jgi:hypothetical protein
LFVTIISLLLTILTCTLSPTLKGKEESCASVFGMRTATVYLPTLKTRARYFTVQLKEA